METKKIKVKKSRGYRVGDNVGCILLDVGELDFNCDDKAIRADNAVIKELTYRESSQGFFELKYYVETSQGQLVNVPHELVFSKGEELQRELSRLKSDLKSAATKIGGHFYYVCQGEKPEVKDGVVCGIFPTKKVHGCCEEVCFGFVFNNNDQLNTAGNAFSKITDAENHKNQLLNKINLR